jgi:hypothetical protein
MRRIFARWVACAGALGFAVACAHAADVPEPAETPDTPDPAAAAAAAEPPPAEPEPVVTIDYLRSLEQAREVVRQTLPPGGSYPAYRKPPSRSALNYTDPPPLDFRVLPADPKNNRLGVRIDAEPAFGIRPYVGADMEATRPATGLLPVPVIEYGALFSAGRDTSVSAGVRQAQPLPGTASDTPPRTFQFGLDRKF